MKAFERLAKVICTFYLILTTTIANCSPFSHTTEIRKKLLLIMRTTAKVKFVSLAKKNHLKILITIFTNFFLAKIWQVIKFLENSSPILRTTHKPKNSPLTKKLISIFFFRFFMNFSKKISEKSFRQINSEF